MAVFATTRPQAGGFGLVDRLSDAIAAVATRFIAWNETRATRDALHNLSDRELDDIGLSRGDIDYVVSRL